MTFSDRFSDEQLSAFLDGELAATEMQALRDALATDQALADRLAELALVDALVRESCHTMDQRPMPASLNALLADHDSQGSGKVLAFPAWKRLGQRFPYRAAIAASIALVAGFGLGQLTPSGDRSSDRSIDQIRWQQVAAVLDSSPSGTSQQLAAAVEVRPRLSYQDTDGNYCRQFQLIDGASREESLACRKGDGWSLQATVYLPPAADTGGYQAASGGSALDVIVDQSLTEGPFDREQESALIDSGWQLKSEN